MTGLHAGATKPLTCKLDEILKERDISIRELSRATEINYELVRRMAAGKVERYPKDQLEKICGVLDIEISDLLVHD